MQNTWENLKEKKKIGERVEGTWERKKMIVLSVLSMRLTDAELIDDEAIIKIKGEVQFSKIGKEMKKIWMRLGLLSGASAVI